MNGGTHNPDSRASLKHCFGIELSSPEWLNEERSFGLDDQHIQESLFTLGNGFIGSRGVLEELPERAMSGTFIASVYDKAGAQVEELVNLPNPIHFIIAAEGEKLDMHFMEVQSHLRYLDMRQGLLVRQTHFRDAKGREYLYQSLRFFHLRHPQVAWMKISVKLLSGRPAEITALNIMDDTVTNTGGLIYGSRRHFVLKKADTKGENQYYAYRTLTSKIWLGYADRLIMERNGTIETLRDRVIDFTLNSGETVTFTKTLAVCTSLQRSVAALKSDTLGILQAEIDKGFEKSFQEHKDEWKTRWDHANVVIKGDDLCDRALRFNIYHLIIAGCRGDPPVGIGARALSGQGYHGHIFWDMEMFLLPFYIHTDPSVARQMLLYRSQRLPAAKKHARTKGFRGALFPWESAGTGHDATPQYAKNIDGSVIKIDTMDYEQHIAADIAWGGHLYYRSTDDIEFMVHHGMEIIFETARFWASRVRLNKTRQAYEIDDVIGPDEFHVKVKNNAYTNIMAKWNLEYASHLYGVFKRERPDDLHPIAQHMRLGQNEADSWNHIAERIIIPNSQRVGLLEQFEGYFKKKDISIMGFDNHFMPEAPAHFSYTDFDKTTFIKQADTLLLIHLFPEIFSEKDKRELYEYYIRRTLHQSSLSHSSHALMAAEAGNMPMAYAFLLFALQVDLKNLHRNTDGGMHIANSGGVWQAVIFGFAGVRFDSDGIKVTPKLPGHWKSITFRCFWKKWFLNFHITNAEVEIASYPITADHSEVIANVFGKDLVLKPFETMKATRPGGQRDMKKIKEIMKKENLITVDEETPVSQVITILTEKNISSVPVVDVANRIRGIISEQDILRRTKPANYADCMAKHIMKGDVICVQDDDVVEAAVRRFTEFPYRHLPVLRDGVVVGIISRDDILSVCQSEYY